MDDEGTDPNAVVIQLLRVLSEIDIDGLGEDLRRIDGATARRAMTGASMLAEALTRATLGADSVTDALDVEFDTPPTHDTHRSQGVRIEVHDDEAETIEVGARQVTLPRDLIRHADHETLADTAQESLERSLLTLHHRHDVIHGQTGGAQRVTLPQVEDRVVAHGLRQDAFNAPEQEDVSVRRAVEGQRRVQRDPRA